jgi:endonuclease/exonuclease/phosphatase family metal-dependent hydrolase
MSRRTGGAALFASYNIHKCIGTDRCFDPARIAQVIAELQADVVALQEADRRFGDRAGLLDLAALERETGLKAVPVANPYGGHGWRGNLLLVRAGRVLSRGQLTLPGQEPRGALVVDLALPAGEVRVVATHLGLLRNARRSQVRVLLAAAGAHRPERPVVLMGDLNEWRHGRRSALQGLSPAFGPVGPGVPSFPARRPLLALDRILAQPQQLLGRIEVHATPLARTASDHLPVKARIRLGVSGAEPSRNGPAPARVHAHWNNSTERIAL